MKDIQFINWDLQHGYIPDKLNFNKDVYYKNIIMKRLPRGFANLPGSEQILDRMVFYMKLRIIYNKKLDMIKEILV